MSGKKNKPLPYTKAQTQKDFANYVEHPRFGKYPRFTGENPQNDYAGGISLHWRSKPGTRIADTAIAADVSRQLLATYQATHYYDENRTCLDCGQPFLFFAQEQKHWYEKLRFPLDADCVRCVNCRKTAQWIARQKKRYDALVKIADKSADETLEMAACCLGLMEEGIFTLKQESQLRRLLKTVKDKHTRHAALLERLTALKLNSLK